MKFAKFLCVGPALLLASASSWTQNYLTPNGYSGLGMVPSASVLGTGTAVFSFDNVLPGALNTKGQNAQFGVGLMDDVELVGRLATNSGNCNMFDANACPPNTIRDLSASLKWSPSLQWLNKNKAKVALGVTDEGGAATYFRSYYAVASKSFGDVDVSLGRGIAKSDQAVLNSAFGAISWKPTNWAQLSLQKIGADQWAHAGVSVPIGGNGVNAFLSYNTRLNESPVTEKNWASVGVSLPLGRVTKNTTAAAPEPREVRLLSSVKPSELKEVLKKYGFYGTKLGKYPLGKVVVEVDSASYQWNIVDAAGVALGIVSSAYASDPLQDFELVINTRGLPQMLIRANAACVKRWLESDTWCEKLDISSLNDRDYWPTTVKWEDDSQWSYRPELILAPALASFVGTEYSAFDIDLGLNVNLILPLWSGAYLDYNQIVPMNIRTERFEPDQPYYASQLTKVTSRRLIHQLVSLQPINTQVRLSAGTAYNVWGGVQMESNTQSSDGRHKFGINVGDFRTDTLPTNNQKGYQLLSYRYIFGRQQRTSTEITLGKFWGGDTGALVAQRFWYDDTALVTYFKQSRQDSSAAPASYAGLQLIFPLTPRKNAGMEYLSIRGTNQFGYGVESRVLETENKLSVGTNEVPRMGDNLLQIMNRDRNSSEYFQSQVGRMKNAFINLSVD